MRPIYTHSSKWPAATIALKENVTAERWQSQVVSLFDKIIKHSETKTVQWLDGNGKQIPAPQWWVTY